MITNDNTDLFIKDGQIHLMIKTESMTEVPSMYFKKIKEQIRELQKTVEVVLEIDKQNCLDEDSKATQA